MPQDCPQSKTACLENTCISQVCGTKKASATTACTDSGGRVCDGAGNCVPCLSNGDCAKGQACAPGNTCVSCAAGGSIAIVTQGSNVTAYVPNGSYEEMTPGVRVVALEGNYPSATTGSNCNANGCTVAPSAVVNTCAADPLTGHVVCTGNDNTVYLVNGVTLVNTTSSNAAAGMEVFSGGACTTCAVAIDPLSHTALVSIATSSQAAIQPLDLTAAFAGNVASAWGAPVGLNGQTASDEGIVVDVTRGLLLSPNPTNDFQLVKPASGMAFDNSFSARLGGSASLDAVGVDCSTGIAVSAVQFGSNQVALVDVSQATFSGTTWSTPAAAVKIQTIPELAKFPFVSAITVAPSPAAHIGAVGSSFGGNVVGIFQLPSTSGAGAAAPAFKDWVMATIPATPGDGKAWVMGNQPYAFTSYTSPTSGKPYLVMQDDVDSQGTRTWLAVVDMQALLFNVLRSDGLLPSTGTASHTISSALQSCQGPPSLTSGCVVGFIHN